MKETWTMNNSHGRLLAYLENCWAVERTAASEWRRMAEEVEEPALRWMFDKHLHTAEAHTTRLESRLRVLGAEPNRSRRFCADVVAEIGDLLDMPRHEEDRPTQFVIKAYGVESLQMAMYESLSAFAGAMGDAETVSLAVEHLQEAKQAARQVWSHIGTQAGQPARLVETGI
jgi:ferritin-like metal-binding protein YciE